MINIARIELESLKSWCISFVVRGLFIGFMISEDDNEVPGDGWGSFSIWVHSSTVMGSSKLARWSVWGSKLGLKNKPKISGRIPV